MTTGTGIASVPNDQAFRDWTLQYNDMTPAMRGTLRMAKAEILADYRPFWMTFTAMWPGFPKTSAKFSEARSIDRARNAQLRHWA